MSKPNTRRLLLLAALAIVLAAGAANASLLRGLLQTATQTVSNLLQGTTQTVQTTTQATTQTLQTTTAALQTTTQNLLQTTGNTVGNLLSVLTSVTGKTATAVIGLLGQPLADVTLNFDEPTGLTPSSLGVRARLLDLGALLNRLPSLNLIRLDQALPLLVTVEPPASGGRQFQRTVEVEVHTHLLTYTPGSRYRLFKAPQGGEFRDITTEIAPGSVRARGRCGGFSEFVVVEDLRPTRSVIAEKVDWLEARIATLPQSERVAYAAHLYAAEGAVAAGNYAAAIAELDALRARASTQAGTQLTETWAAGGANNEAGDLISGADTLKFSIAYLRDYGD